MAKYDLHTHFFTNPHKGKYSLERSSREPWVILDAVKKAGLDGIGFGNFGTYGTWKDSYEQFLIRAKEGQLDNRYKLCREIKNAATFTDEQGEINVIKIQEIPTTPNGGGHIVTIGLNHGEIIKGRTGLLGILTQLQNKGVVTNADHYNGLSGITEQELREYQHLIDCFEGFNANYCHNLLKPLLGTNPTPEQADTLEKELGIHWIATSDCHNRKDVGNGYIETQEDFDFSSADNLRDSIRETLTTGRFKPICKKPNPLKSVLGHMVIYIYDTQVRNRVGLTNLEPS